MKTQSGAFGTITLSQCNPFHTIVVVGKIGGRRGIMYVRHLESFIKVGLKKSNKMNVHRFLCRKTQNLSKTTSLSVGLGGVLQSSILKFRYSVSQLPKALYLWMKYSEHVKDVSSIATASSCFACITTVKLCEGF